MNDRVFIDSNIVVYMFPKTDPTKQLRARELIKGYSKKNSAVISFQVIQEFINVAIRKYNDFVEEINLFEFVETILYPMWKINPSREFYNKTYEIKLIWKFSFYDILIVAAATEAECSIIYSEDLQHVQKIYTTEIVNPFL